MLRSPAILRLFWKTDVTICIPAFQAATFIDRTLRCAQGQTYGRVRILVAVDRSTDETARICRQFCKDDARIEVVEHEQRLGWCGNVNSLLERAETPFFFIYFHDDLILPQYCERLRETLLERRDAASAHCDLLDFGVQNILRPAQTYDGPVAQRLLLWAIGKPGIALRSMTRRESVGPDYRLPPEESNSFVAGHIIQMRMIAAGPAVRVAETLYLRWAREGGLTEWWRRLPYETVLRGRQDELALTFSVVDETVSAPDDKHALKFALTLYAFRKLATRCRAEDRPLPRLADLHPDAPDLDLIPKDIERFGPEIANHLRKSATKTAKIAPKQKWLGPEIADHPRKSATKAAKIARKQKRLV